MEASRSQNKGIEVQQTKTWGLWRRPRCDQHLAALLVWPESGWGGPSSEGKEGVEPSPLPANPLDPLDEGRHGVLSAHKHTPQAFPE